MMALASTVKDIRRKSCGNRKRRGKKVVVASAYIEVSIKCKNVPLE